jgi:hypothetical protein
VPVLWRSVPYIQYISGASEESPFICNLKGGGLPSKNS